MTIQIIGIMGLKGSGKSTLAKLIRDKYKFKILSFADPIKSMLLSFVSNQGCPFITASDMFYGNLKETPSDYLGGKTPRYAMQTIGIEWRDMMSKTLYSDAWKRRVLKFDNSKVIVDDLRFSHEAEMLRNTPEFNSTIILVTNSSSIKSDLHPSERELFKISPDITITNVKGAPEEMLSFLEHSMKKTSLPL